MALYFECAELTKTHYFRLFIFCDFALWEENKRRFLQSPSGVQIRGSVFSNCREYDRVDIMLSNSVITLYRGLKSQKC